MEISSLTDKQFKVIVIKLLTEMGKSVQELKENFNQKIENIKSHSELKSTINKMKNTIEGMNSRLQEVEQWIRVMEDREVQSNQAEAERKKDLLKMRRC